MDTVLLPGPADNRENVGRLFIVRAGLAVAEIVRTPAQDEQNAAPRRTFGHLRGQFVVPAAIDASNDDIAALFGVPHP